MKYEQKLFLLVSETEDDYGFLPLVHGTYTAKNDAENALELAGNLHSNLRVNIKIVSGVIDFEI